MIGKFQVTDPFSVIFTLQFTQTLESWQSLLNQLEAMPDIEELPESSNLARMISSAIEKATATYNLSLQSIEPLPPDPVGVFNVDQIEITWDAVDSADSYKVYGKLGTGVTTSHFITNTTDLFYNHSPVLGGSTYSIRVSAVNSGGESELSDEITVAVPLPDAPVIYGTRVDTNNIAIAWDAIENATEYRLYAKGTPGVTDTDPLIYTGSNLSYTHPTTGPTYYRATAASPVGVSGLSNEIGVS
jgi:fibronectin type 3 domain-containing protein